MKINIKIFNLDNKILKNDYSCSVLKKTYLLNTTN